MRVFVTGASGFVGSAIVKELLSAGHKVLGLVRSEDKAKQLISNGAEAYYGNLDEPESLIDGTSQCDAVIHTAFNHDFSRYKENCENDRKIITLLGNALAGSNRPLVVTSGIGIINSDGLITEDDLPPSSDIAPRAASEEAANALAEKGAKTYIVRLPPTVHGQGDHAFIPVIVGIAKEKGVSAYVDSGENKWSAVHRLDAARVYRLIIEQQPKQKVFHAAGEQGIAFKDIAAAIGKGLGIPVISKTASEAAAHFGWIHHFVAIGVPASAQKTMDTLGWLIQEPGLLDDIAASVYF